MPTLATLDNCTGCGVCSFKCSKKCISMECNSIGTIVPVINIMECVECGNCEQVCPALNKVEKTKPMRAYAAWNVDYEQRRTSASGGIAAAIYKYAVKQGVKVIGASQNEDWSVTYKIVDNETEISQFKNSRYVFSEPYHIYSELKQLLKDDEKVLMVGLPCQIAAIRKLYPNNQNLFLIDIVCHGIMSTSYLRQHISSLELSLKSKASRMSFRAPEKGTSNYFFTLYDNDGKIFYSKRSADGDVYNIAFHRSIAYRDNCYNCQYACPERVSDLTLGDYHGLGMKSPVEYDDKDVSVILVNTVKGKEIIDAVRAQGLIHMDSRPVDEPIEGDRQLRHPSPKTRQHEDFAKLIVKNNGDFEKSIKGVISRANKREKINFVINLPRRIICEINRILKGKK